MAASSKFRLSLHSRRHLRTIIQSFQHQQHTTPSSSPLLQYSSLPVSDDVAAVELPPLSAILHCSRFLASTAAPTKPFSSSLGRFSSESLWSRQLHQQAMVVDDLQHRELIPLLPKAKEQEKSIPVKAYFLCTSVDLKSMQTEDGFEVILSSSRSSNYIACRFCDAPPVISCFGVPEDRGCCPHMVVFQYGAVVLFNIADNDVERYLDIVRKHASGLLSEMRKDDYAVKERPQMETWMQTGPDYIILKNLDIDAIRIIGSVLGQSIALDYFVRQVDGIVQEFTEINRGMEKTGTFTMERLKLFQLLGKANSNMADVIIKLGLFERSEIAWRDANYAQIWEYLRDEFELTQRFGSLDFKLKFVEHNIHFLQEILQNKKSDSLEWCIIVLLSLEIAIEALSLGYQFMSSSMT